MMAVLTCDHLGQRARGVDAANATALPFASGTGLVVELTMTQTWANFIDVQWAMTNGVDWFVSTLLGCVLLHSLLGECIVRITSTPLTALLGAALAATLRAGLLLLAYAVPESTLYPAASFPHSFDLVLKFAPAAFPGYVAGMCTARLVHALSLIHI